MDSAHGVAWLAGIDLIVAVRLLGLAGMSGVIVCALLWYARTRPAAGRLVPAGVGVCFFALAAPIAVWSIGGLEQPLHAALLALAIVLCDQPAASRNAGRRSSASRPRLRWV